ncbi:hypothetical protein BACCIP111899_03764 [Bacillus rhizoplanae]|uniref:DUF1572 domain-containing protein n=1 Tax=Bacillus rhizoplanae TaxID=2880966 RepID=A0ABM8YFR1_9BACI|nr:DUF1572 domain-containing protein [Bacillus rhizoplanae]CAG9614531.1 hypothetical protein BACCIP111899_03764 [Bacillus rhizoplanae]
MGIEKEYLRCVLKTFQSMKKLGENAMDQLSYEELHKCPNEESNSIAIIVKHMWGNMLSRWTNFLTTDGEKTNRNRDDEFTGAFPSKAALYQAWNQGWEVLFTTLNSLKENNLEETIYIRGEAHSVIEAIERQISHYSYHIGQIVYVGKFIKNEQWNCLSVPRGKSIEYTEKLMSKHKNLENK